LSLLQDSEGNPEFLNAILENCIGRDLEKCAEAAERAEECLKRRKKYTKTPTPKKSGENETKTTESTVGVTDELTLYPGKQYRIDKDKARRYFLPLMHINAPAAIVTVESVRRIPENPDEALVHVKAEYGNLKKEKSFIVSMSTLKEKGILKEG
jgi:hypothetical protein